MNEQPIQAQGSVDIGLIGEQMERAGETVLAATWYVRAGRQAQTAWLTGKAIDYYQRAARMLPEGDEYAAQRVDIFEGLGLMLFVQGHNEEAITAYAAMRAAAAIVKDRRDQAQALNGMAMAGCAVDDWATALQQATEAEELAQQVGAQHEVAAAILRQALAQQGLGDSARARQLAERAIVLNSTLTAWNEAGHCFAMLAHASGYDDEAEQLASSAVTAYRVAGDKWGLMMMLKYLGDIAVARSSQPGSYYDEARRIALEIDNRSVVQELGTKDEWRSDLARRKAQKSEERGPSIPRLTWQFSRCRRRTSGL